MKHVLVTALWLVACGRSGFDDVTTTGDGATGDSDRGDGAISDGTPTVYAATLTTFNGSASPAPRRSSGAAYNVAGEQAWIYGGYDGTFRSDVHVYTPATDSWLMVGAGGTPPGARERHALTWDPVSNALVVFGGQNRPMIQLVHYDTLHVLTSAWKQIPKAGSWPAARKDATLIWIPHRSQFLLYGGDDGGMTNNRFDDLWYLTLDVALDTATWQLLTPGGVQAPAQSSACVVYDPAAHRLILYGGETADGVDVATTYQYLLDTNVWQQDTTTGTPPSGESFAQCAWDPVSQRVLLYGGQQNGGVPLGAIATYDPDAHVWATPQIVSGSPGDRSDGGAVYIASLGGMLWYGGRTGGSVYTSELVLMKLDAQ